MEGRPENQRQEPRWRLYAGLAILALAIIFIAQNSQEVEVDFIVAQTDTPLVFALLISFVAGLAVGLVLPRFRRRD
jgi:uncharacterized integral membrane protein